MKITQQLLEQFYDYYRNRNFQPDTITNYKRDMSLFLQLFYTRGLSEVEEISLPLIEEWRTQLRNTPTPKKSIHYGVKPYLSEATIQGKVQAVKKFLEYVNESYNIGMNCQKIKVPKVRYISHDYFEEGEVENIVDIVRTTEKSLINRIRSELLVVLGFTTGMRVSEMLSLKVREVLNGEICVLGKGQKERYISFLPYCQELLRDYISIRKKPLPRA